VALDFQSHDRAWQCNPCASSLQDQSRTIGSNDHVVAQMEAPSMRKIVRCSCGMHFQEEDESVLIALVRVHALQAHALELSDDQIRDLMEIEQ
jgi:hypothetical protein